MQPNLEKRPAGSPKSGENPEIVVVDVSFGGGVSCFRRLWLVPMSPAFGLHRETIMDDDRKDVQPYPVELWPESGRRGEGNSPLSQSGGPLGG